MTIQIWRLLVAPPANFSSKNARTNESGERFMSVGCFSEEFVQHQENKNTLRKNRCFVVEKVVSFKEWTKRVGNYWCKKSRGVNCQFSTSSSKERWKTIRAHIAEVFCLKLVSAFSVFVICVIDSSRHRKCFVLGCIHSLVCVKSPHSLVSRSFWFWHKQLVNITPYAALSMT